MNPVFPAQNQATVRVGVRACREESSSASETRQDFTLKEFLPRPELAQVTGRQCRPVKVHSPAFTLIELLAVIVIIGILAAILVPVVSKVRQSAANAQCVSALRQYGLAIQMYVNDRRDSKLPGPLFGHILPQTRTSNGEPANNHLFSFIAPYLSLKTTYTDRYLPDEYICLGWRRNVPIVDWKTKAGPPVYLLGGGVKTVRYSNKNPWGNANDENSNPLSWAEVVSENPASRTCAIKDVDEMNTHSFPGKLPKDAVHGNHRNQLYFDWHVGSISKAESDKTP
ncbi:MAG: type II secretion system GspH family protein [Opitutaceae bacterium]|jgi:prepilin-type N-terminal cleavage/methylation domain-containing protein/prepilin-type processing-associated H-X9-DG protein|nr:type II secretion system GspH family protein [Opitutaceae bacterium]